MSSQYTNVEEVLQLSKGMKKCYMIENSKVVTNVYFNKLRSEISEALKVINDRILQY